MSCEIIQFSAIARTAGNRVPTPRQRRREGKPELPSPATETAKNFRIRIARRDTWWHTDRVLNYWRARLDWCSALGVAQQYGIADSGSLPSAENGLDWSTNGAKQLRRSCLRRRPILPRSLGNVRNSRAVISSPAHQNRTGGTSERRRRRVSRRPSDASQAGHLVKLRRRSLRKRNRQRLAAHAIRLRR